MCEPGSIVQTDVRSDVQSHVRSQTGTNGGQRGPTGDNEGQRGPTAVIHRIWSQQYRYPYRRSDIQDPIRQAVWKTSTSNNSTKNTNYISNSGIRNNTSNDGTRNNSTCYSCYSCCCCHCCFHCATAMNSLSGSA